MARRRRLERRLYVARQAPPRTRCAGRRRRRRVPLLRLQLLVAHDRLQGHADRRSQLARVLPGPARPAAARARWRWSTRASAPTRCRPGGWRTRSAIMAHNGEINTLRGNINWMTAREKLFASPRLRRRHQAAAAGHRARPERLGVVRQRARAALRSTGRSLPHAITMMIPEAWEKHESMPRRAEGVLPVPRGPDGAVGRPGVDRVLGRPPHRRRARPQRPAPVALPRHHATAWS